MPTPSVPSTDTHVPAKVAAFVMLLAFLWGGNVVAIKMGLEGVPPFAAAGVRFGIALPLIAAWAAVRGVSIIPLRSEVPRLLALGAVFAAQIALIYLGTNLTLAGRSTVFVNVYPVYVAGISHFFVPGDRLTVRKSVGLAVALAGIVVVFGYSFFESGRSTLLGDAMVIVSGILLSALVVMINRIAQKTPPARLLVAEMAVGVPVFFLLSAVFESGTTWQLTLPVAGALAYQAVIVATFCFIAWSTILKKHAPSKVSVVFFTTPLWGVLLSFLVLGERISTSLLVGAAFVAVGIYLVNRKERQAWTT